MFKDDYRSAIEKINASDELKNKTLEKINMPRKATKNSFVKYGLVCASFLFVMAMFPVLYGNGGLTTTSDSKNPTPNTVMPQTGVDESIVSNIDNSLKDHYKASEKAVKELKDKQAELDSLIKEQKSQPAQATLEAQQAPAPEDDKILEYEKEIKEIEKQLSSEIIATPAQNAITLNVIEQPFASAKIRNFADDTSVISQDWTKAQIVEYLGASPVLSYVPADLTWGYPQTDENFTQKVYLNKADETLVYDTFSYSFAAPQITRELNPLRRVIRCDVAKAKLPLTDCLYMKDDAKASTIIGVDMKLGVSYIPYKFNEKKEPIEAYEMYVAEFIHNDIGYRLVSSNLTQREFTDVIASVIVPKK